jgi:hypothetical protein
MEELPIQIVTFKKASFHDQQQHDLIESWQMNRLEIKAHQLITFQ